MKCKFCNMEFEVNKKMHYIARDNRELGLATIASNKEEKIYDAIDCPKCGSQIIVQERKRTYLINNENEEEIEEELNEEESNEENETSITNFDLIKRMDFKQMSAFLHAADCKGYCMDQNCKYHCKERVNGECIHDGNCTELEIDDIDFWLKAKVGD